MKTVQDYITSDLLNWLHDNNFKHRQAQIQTDKGTLNNLYNDKFCLKIYDRLGHGFGVTINVADKYDESIFDNDSFNLHWAFEYFKIKQTASFDSRTVNQYEQNLPNLMSDIKNIIPRLNQLTFLEWGSMKEWIALEARKHMENKILFTENQKFNQWWLWLILLGSNALVAYGVIIQVVFNKQFGDKPSGNVELLLVFALTLLITFSLYILRLETVIKTDGIYVKFFPFHGSFRRYPWENIQKSYVRKYSPIGEYGGWGLRGLGKNKALNVSGNQGLQLELEGNKRLLIGTRKPEEIIEVLRKIGKQ